MRVYVSRMIAALLAIAGISLALYPSAASWIYQYNQAKVFGDYAKEISHLQPDARTQITQARKYNAALSSGAAVPSFSHKASGTGKIDSSKEGIKPYQEQLVSGRGDIIGRVVVESADIDLPIYRGATEENLLKGAAHLEGTSLPVGGTDTRTVITGHRGLANAEMFTHLDRVKKGDLFSINVLGEIFTYKVFEIKVVEPEDSDSILPQAGKDLATLITCTPLGINSHRILVTGERVHPTPAAEQDRASGASDLPHFPWLLLGGGVGIVVALVYIVRNALLAYRSRRSREQRGQSQPSRAQRGRARHGQSTDGEHPSTDSEHPRQL